MPVRLTVVGGFLGAGKTSAIARMAALLIGQGHKVGIVTNDQSENLVDTNFLRSEGRTVVEVTKGCFCCNFDEFTLKLKSLSQAEFPDIILAEPVGSCTDLIATIFKPIMNDYTREFVMAPLSVLADPRR
ncbi:MAG TPA: GTP-binding protein, partial [Clostridia bacterium]|nr:GTP-binding protein [Clostridia bacterium]